MSTVCSLITSLLPAWILPMYQNRRRIFYFNTCTVHFLLFCKITNNLFHFIYLFYKIKAKNMFYIRSLYSSCQIVSIHSLVHMPFPILLLILQRGGVMQGDLPVYCPYIVL
jgi:hypothetical protein